MTVPRLLAISDRHSLQGGSSALVSWLEALRAAGVDGVQIREKDLADRALAELLTTARQTLGTGVTLLVNGRADIALACGADGVHLPADGLPARALRRRFGAALVIGVSTHHPEEVAAAQRDGADYVTFGPIYPTPSKEAYGPPPGLSGLQRATACGLPVLALGGVDHQALPAVAAVGAAGAAGIRIFQDLTRLGELCAARDRLWT